MSEGPGLLIISGTVVCDSDARLSLTFGSDKTSGTREVISVLDAIGVGCVRSDIKCSPAQPDRFESRIERPGGLEVVEWFGL